MVRHTGGLTLMVTDCLAFSQRVMVLGISKQTRAPEISPQLHPKLKVPLHLRPLNQSVFSPINLSVQALTQIIPFSWTSKVMVLWILFKSQATQDTTLGSTER